MIDAIWTANDFIWFTSYFLHGIAFLLLFIMFRKSFLLILLGSEIIGGIGHTFDWLFFDTYGAFALDSSLFEAVSAILDATTTLLMLIGTIMALLYIRKLFKNRATMTTPSHGVPTEQTNN